MDSVASVLFGKTRQAVFAQLFSFPEEKVYLRELERRTGISSGSLQAELNQLVAADLVRRQQDGNRVLYAANTQSPVFEELRGLILKTTGLPEQIRAALSPLQADIKLAFIYGSMAKGNASAGSDVDLLVVGKLALQDLITALQPVEQRIAREINTRLFDEAEFAQRKQDGERFITGVLSGKLITLIGDLNDA
ncbi:nucleotidyltransferase domain-containing protein [Viridibacterium curvum]|uniref:Polymerase beta nucleotidyltransferase domain-containing protein n=1 Tax=Viridibacterium curvum TaxID=1101404 RepID=A0ABP9QRQ3_9RHOO